MAKKRRKKKSGSGAQAIRLLVLAFVVLAAGGVFYLYQDSAKRLVAVRDYIAAKQEMRDALGKESRLVAPLFSFLRWIPSGIDEKFTYQIEPAKAHTTLDVTMRRENGTWLVSGVALVTPTGDKKNLSAVRIGDIKFYAASKTSAPLKRPFYAEGEDVHVVATLAGLSTLPVGTAIKETIRIYDDNNALVTELKDIGKNVTTAKSDSMRFSSRIESLDAGKYFVQFVFFDGAGKELDNNWQEIAVKKIAQEIIVKSVVYYEDAGRTKKREEAEFLQGEMIYFAIKANGFRSEKNKVAGSVDLTVTDERGEVIVKKPAFVSFNQDYKPEYDVAITGQVRLDVAGVYLFEFIINDFFTKRQLTHTEKVNVLLKK